MDDRLDYTNSSPRIRKKGGRGPGKKDNKEKSGVSVRWEEADLTDRLINALHTNELWAGVFIATSTAEHSRAVIGMPKSDLQREIARFLFADDQRFDLEDTRTIDLLGTSVKNKVNKIRKLYNECKEELGPAANSIVDEKDIPPDSELGQTWARVKEKLPQYLQVRDIMNRPVVSSQALDVSSVGDSSGAQGQGAHGFRGGRSVSTPFPMESPGLPYSESPVLSPMQGGSHNNGRQQTQTQYMRYYPPPPQPAPPRTSYPQVPYPLALSDPSGSSHIPLFPGLPPPVLSQAPPPLQIPSYNPPRVRSSHGPDSQDPHSPLNPLATDDQRPQSRSSSRDSRSPLPSPPLTQTFFQMFRALESRKRQREEEYVSLKRMKLEHKEMQKQREERERQRWHEREMLRLQIQLEKYKREGPDPQLAAGEDAQYHGGESSGLQGGSGAPGASIEHPHSALQQHTHLQHTLESHERGAERPEHESHHARLSGIDIGGHTTHHSHLQQQQPPQQQQSHHQHHVMHSSSETLGGPTTAGPLSSGDAALDALTSLREGTSSGGLR